MNKITLSPKAYELWKDIRDYEGYYQISNHGNVRSLDRLVNTNGGKRLVKGRRRNTSKLISGYLNVCLSKNGKEKGLLIHRLVGLHFIENKEHKPEINHIDGDKSNNHYSNLEWCTGSENKKHAFATGLRKPSSNGQSKLTNNQARDIREYKKYPSFNAIKLARKYKVSPSTIYNIIGDKTYKEFE